MKPRTRTRTIFILTALLGCGSFAQDVPRAIDGGYILPSGWRITPIGKTLPTEDMVLNILSSPDRSRMIALHSGYNPHGLVVIDSGTGEIAQKVPLPSAWLGMAWMPGGERLYVSGGTGNTAKPFRPSIYALRVEEGSLIRDSAHDLMESSAPETVYWSGLAHHPTKNLLFAANRGTGSARSNVVVFDTNTGKLLYRIPVEVNPYAVTLNEDGSTLYVTNWASHSIGIIDTESMRVVSTVRVGGNPNDMALSRDGRLFVACANDDSVIVIDTKTRRPVEKISTALTLNPPNGSTPNALALDEETHRLFVANADNNAVAVMDVAEAGKTEILGFIPSGWYPTALALGAGGKQLYVGNSKGSGSFSDIYGVDSPLRRPGDLERSGRSLRKGSVNIVDLSDLKHDLPHWTRQVAQNTPYSDELLVQARQPVSVSVIPREVGAGSPIHHVLYIIKENRTYDQVMGDLTQGNGDARLTIFGRKTTPNHHAIAEQFVLFDNLYADGEVSADGHSWSDAAYATDFAEKRWPVVYSGRGNSSLSEAYVPGGGYIWDLCLRKGLTYRTYGEYGVQVSGGAQIQDAPGAGSLHGHAAPDYRKPGMRDTDNAAVFLREFTKFEAKFDSSDPSERLPNFMVMSLPEDHTKGTRPGAFTPAASVANNDLALGQIVDRISHSKYWPETAIFVIEDDAQEGPDHVDARRTVGFAISPFIKRNTVDSTLYSTSSILRTIELLLGLPPMTQFDAAAHPMYASFGAEPDLTPYQHLEPLIDVNAKNTLRSYGARRSMEMELDELDEAPMFALNEIIWKSVKGANSPMPLPIHRYRFFGQ